MKNLQDSVLVFLHIKKTGGISLQKILAKQYGKRFYGGHTHSALRKIAAKNSVEKNNISSIPNGSCICKHWTYQEFDSIKDRANFITIVRDPLDRIVSHYNFYLMHYPKGQSFAEYVEDPKNINIYSRFLPKNLKQLSEIYFFDSLQESINKSRILSEKDLSKTNKTRYIYTPSSEELDKFCIINQIDMELYDRIKMWVMQL